MYKKARSYVLILIVLATIGSFSTMSQGFNDNTTSTSDLVDNQILNQNVVLLAEKEMSIEQSFNQFKLFTNGKLSYNIINDITQINKESTLIIFGHGTIDGLYLNSDLILWNELAKLLATYDNLENVILSVCYGGLLSNYVDKEINVFGTNELVDAKIGAFTSAIHSLIINDKYDLGIHQEITTDLYNRVNELESGAEPMYLAKYRKSYIVVNSVWGIPWEAFGHEFYRLTGNDATGFYNAMNNWVTFSSIVTGILGYLQHWSVAVALVITAALWLVKFSIEASSPFGEAVFGIWANILPLPVSGLIIGYGWFLPTSMSFDAAYNYGRIYAWNTYGSWENVY